jgi:hypothetical protein
MTEIFMKLTPNGASLSVSRRSASHINVRLGCEDLQLKLLAKNNYTIGVEKRKIFKLSFQIEVQNFFILRL